MPAAGFIAMQIVADNLNVVNPVVSRAMACFDRKPIRQIVRQCQQAGAQAIDINPGPLTRQPEERIAFLVETVQDVTSLPLMLDTTNPKAMAAGLDACRNPAVINGFSLEPAKLESILPLAQQYSADIIGYLLYPDSRVPITGDEIMAVAVSLFHEFEKSGGDPRRLIVDPVVAPLAWENGISHNQGILSAIRSLPDLLGVPVRTIAGLSNLTSGAPVSAARQVMEQAFLSMLAAAGLDLVLMNVMNGKTVQVARACELLSGRRIFSWAAVSPDASSTA